MIVVDASAAVELLLRTDRGRWVEQRVLSEERRVPQVFEYEVLSALRRASAQGDLGEARARMVLDDLADLRVIRHPPTPLLSRIWELRDSLTVYDASYVALAEALDAPVVTADARLARSHGHGALIELVPT